jgi:nickel-dependent lactate racemase
MGNLISSKNEDEIILDALRRPYGSPRLSELAKGKKTAAIIISDHTRPVPSQHIIPHLLAELRRANPKIDITLLVATGAHRGPTRSELAHKLGERIVREEEIVVHDCDDTDSLITLGTLPSGATLTINKWAVETDLLLAEGLIEPHFFAGYSGGGKSVLPGICGRQTILENHCASFIDSTYARAGILENNPIQTDIVAAAKMAKLAYIANAVINCQKQMVAAFAGSYLDAHRAGCQFVNEQCRIAPVQKGDIVITSNGGAPLDQNIYQAVKGMSTAEAAAEPHAVIIICARCADGTGGDDFFIALRDCASATELLAAIQKRPADETVQDQWEYQILARILAKHHVIFVAEPDLAATIRQMKMEYAATIEAALRRAREIKGELAHVVVIPDGVSVVVDER